MSIKRSAGPVESAHASRTLADRRPGHAAMTQLLRRMDRGGHGTVVPASLASWYVGSLGELLVGQELAQLPAGWTVLHAVPVGPKADIDHLVIGPGGVFVLNTKRHPGRTVRVGTHVVWVSGVRAEGYQHALLDRAGKVAELLRPVLGEMRAVQPLLVFADAARVSTVGPQLLPALSADALVAHLLAQPPVLRAEEVRALAVVMGHPATWGCRPAVVDEPDPTSRFLTLRLPDHPALPDLMVDPVVVERRASARSCSSDPVEDAIDALHERRRLFMRALTVSTAVAVSPLIALGVVAFILAGLQAIAR